MRRIWMVAESPMRSLVSLGLLMRAVGFYLVAALLALSGARGPFAELVEFVLPITVLLLVVAGFVFALRGLFGSETTSTRAFVLALAGQRHSCCFAYISR